MFSYPQLNLTLLSNTHPQSPKFKPPLHLRFSSFYL